MVAIADKVDLSMASSDGLPTLDSSSDSSSSSSSDSCSLMMTVMIAGRAERGIAIVVCVRARVCV